MILKKALFRYNFHTDRFFLCFIVLICKYYEVPLRFECTFCSGTHQWIKIFLTKENIENFKAYWKKLNVGDEYWHSTDDNYEYILKTYLNKLGY